MDSCIFTGYTVVERHHIFGAASRKVSEQYGYVVPLRPDLHPNGVYADKRYAKQIDDYLKDMAQRDFEEKHGNRALFIQLFGKSYIKEDISYDSKEFIRLLLCKRMP